MISKIICYLKDEEKGKFFSDKNSDLREEEGEKAVAVPGGIHFSTRRLAYLVLLLLILSRLLLLFQCKISYAKQLRNPVPIIQQWTVTKDQSWLAKVEILSKSDRHSEVLGYIEPGDTVQTFNSSSTRYHRVIEPIAGFIPKHKGGNSKGVHLLKGQKPVIIPSFCPLAIEGWWPSTKISHRYLYSPMILVVAQQLWNAMQVFQLYLVLVLRYAFLGEPGQRVTWLIRTVIRIVSFLSIIVLPISSQLISPGATIFAVITLITAIIAIASPVSTIRLAVGEERESRTLKSINNSKNSYHSKQWILIREETLACFCNLGSSLYNYEGSYQTWPHWKSYFYRIDDYFGWPKAGECFVNNIFSLGLKNIRIPLFVPRSTGSTTGATQFVVVWSILPFLYVSYFGCMFLMSHRSPAVRLQRLLCSFGMLHFLFFTDVVDYRYGRGYGSPYAEYFHWLEKWTWRIAILMPIYQNCTNGHWENGHKQLGKALKYALIIWSSFFFCFQIIQSDVVKFTFYLTNGKQEGLLEKYKLADTPILRNFVYPYREALVTMIIMYSLLHITCFRLLPITLREQQHYSKRRSE